MTKPIFILFLSLICGTLFSQERFNTTLPTQTNDSPWSIKVENNGYTILSWKGNGSGKFLPIRYTFDALGSFADSATTDIGERIDGRFYPFKDYFAIGGWKDSSSTIQSWIKPFLVVLGENDDTLWTYHDKNIPGYGTFWQPIYDGENAIYAIGSFDPSGTYSRVKGFIIKFDTLGNKIWRSEYTLGGGSEKFISGFFHDNHLYISGHTSTYSVGSDFDAFLTKIDTSGNQLWINNWGDQFFDNTACKLLNDSTIMLYGADANGVNISSNYLIRVDTSGNTIWEKTIHLNTMDDDSAIDLVELPNTDMVILSSYKGPDSNDKKIAVLYKMDTARNIIWTRKYSIGSEHHNVYDLEKTDDGGFVFTGFVYPDGAHGQDPWIIKVDSMGCDIPLCYLGERELGLDVPVLKAFPNPTSSSSTIDLPKDSKVLQLFNVNGQRIVSYNIGNNSSSFNIDLSSFEYGIYILKLISKDNRIIGQGKIVKK